MIYPFLLIFFGQVLGMGEGLAGAGVAASAIGGVIFTLLVAGFIDRLGARRALLLTTLGVAVVTAMLPLVTSWPIFFLVMVLYGCADNLYWPALETRATTLVPTEQAGETFAVLRVGEALGFGTGELVGGLIVAGGMVDHYRPLFLASATSTVVSVLLILALVRTLGKLQAHRPWLWNAETGRTSCATAGSCSVSSSCCWWLAALARSRSVRPPIFVPRLGLPRTSSSCCSR